MKQIPLSKMRILAATAPAKRTVNVSFVVLIRWSLSNGNADSKICLGLFEAMDTFIPQVAHHACGYSRRLNSPHVLQNGPSDPNRQVYTHHLLANHLHQVSNKQVLS